MFKKALYIFRRDLRLVDNTAWRACVAKCEKIIPCFIVNPAQVGNKNIYRADASLQFMVESLDDLNTALGGKLVLLHGTNETVLKRIIQEQKIDAVFTNMDYTPYARVRDKTLRNICDTHSIKYQAYEDIMLVPIGAKIKTSTGGAYQKFTPYYLAAKKKHVPEVHNAPSIDNSQIVKIPGEITWPDMRKLYTPLPQIHVHGGRTQALTILKKLQSNVGTYANTHDLPAHETTNLSAYNKFGCVSIREVYHAIFHTMSGKHRDALIRQLYWRDFYYYVAWYFPHVLSANSKSPSNRNFKPNYKHVRWYSLIRDGIANSGRWKPTELALKQFNAWKNGTTGIPIVDAGMRQLNSTGYMHNRVRLIVGNFLTRDMHWHWEDGELYFAQHLVDYDPAQNNGNWQWIAGSGVDSQPYFRIFNPWLQAKNLDPHAEYIKKWVPELRQVPVEDIHNWTEAYSRYASTVLYPAPMLDHETEKNKALTYYKSAFKGGEE